MAGVKDASVKGGDIFSPQTLKVSHCLSGQTGTLMYMSPEMFKEEPYTEAVDVFSFAVVMYELFHRYLMLHAISLEGTDEEVEAYAERVSNGFRPPIAPHLGPEFQSLLQQCWAQDPATRPRMDQVVQRLRQLQLEGLMGPGTEPQGCQCAIC
ncbi:dual specificity protein kinase shkE [Haematococcus lacustris]|uniref:Dual specificity protein kinase shkE n=1 Tax=Haematococcus lacustris TaxID=44745 RepID=A0A6A0AB78_HAELA|nr:dual specificity protein kinase shkE [Haematococcus lacustris]